MFSNLGKSFTFLLFGCFSAFCAADAFAQNKQPEHIPSLESPSAILNSPPDAEVRADSEKSQTDDPLKPPRSVQTTEKREKIISEDKSDVEKEKLEPLNFNRQGGINNFRCNFSSTEDRKRRFLFNEAAIARAERFSFRPPLAASFGDLKNPAAPGDAATVQNGKTEGFHWRSAIGQSLMFLAVQHGYAFTQPKTREALKGKFWKDYVASVKSLSGWEDGGRFFTNYIAHPMQGAFTGFIYVQNDPKGLKQQFGASGDYWRSRLKAMAWSAAWSTQFEIGPLSQASIGNVGLKGKQTWGDIVVTPTVGTAMLVSEDAIDRFVMKRIERATGNFYVRIFSRMLLNPTRTVANLFRFKEPWYRDRPREH